VFPEYKISISNSILFNETLGDYISANTSKTVESPPLTWRMRKSLKVSGSVVINFTVRDIVLLGRISKTSGWNVNFGELLSL
jgi:hypothetical protein